MMITSKKVLVSIIAALFLLSSFATITYAADEEYIINIGANQDPDVLNAFTTTAGASGNIIEKIYESMFFVLNDRTFVPWLADSWEVSDDATEYTYYLNPDAMWSDGTPLTADDVVFTFEMLMANELEIPTVGEIDTVEALDAHTVKFTTKTSLIPFLYRSGIINIMPKHIWSEIDDPVTFTNNENPIGSGPFLFDKWFEGEYVTLKKNPNYWKGDVLIDKINVITYRSSDALALALKAGEIDLAGVDPSQVGTYVGTKDVAIDQANVNRLCYVGWNLR